MDSVRLATGKMDPRVRDRSNRSGESIPQLQALPLRFGSRSPFRLRYGNGTPHGESNEAEWR